MAWNIELLDGKRNRKIILNLIQLQSVNQASFVDKLNEKIVKKLDEIFFLDIQFSIQSTFLLYVLL